MSGSDETKQLNFSQQRKIFEPKYAKPITVLGAGSVGSWVVVMLSKLGIKKITVYDGDAIESHNIPPSAYGISDLGMFKVFALRELALRQSGTEINAIPRMYVGEQLRDSVIACVDSMEARQKIWNEVKGNPLVDVFIDTRVAAELVSVFAVNPCNPEDVAYYEHFMYPTEQAVHLMCGMHGIVYGSTRAAGIACANLTNLWQYGKKNLHFKELVRTLEVC